MIDRRIILAASAFLVGGLAYGALTWRLDKAPRDERWFWVNKIEWGPEFDVVLAGDSRVNRGVDPKRVEAEIGPLRTANFGFSGQGFSQDYIDRLPKLLDPKGRRVLVLGLTPRSFTDLAVNFGDYRVWASKRPVDMWAMKHLPLPDTFNTPHSPVLLFGRAVSKSAPSYSQWFTPEGWMPADRSSHDTVSAQGEYRDLFAAHKSKDEHIARLEKAVRGWTEQGIQVLCFEPPISEDIKKIEEAESGYDPAQVRERMESAGATWVSVEGEFKTFDGHHLARSSAETFSTELGRAISAALGVRSE
ncbi:MAG: hypothetical protein MH204_04845 [Fimbriimonadaceae bacterium]|nr:hypothetical protein [Fimbriimonadaceae bacterium]